MEEFVDLLTVEFRAVLIQTAVHNAQPNISMFIFYLSETANDTDLLKEYIMEITSPNVMTLNTEEVNKIYQKLLEDLYLYEDKFYAVCEELGLIKT